MVAPANPTLVLSCSYLPWFEVFYKLLNIMADYTIRGQVSPGQHGQQTLVPLSLVVPVKGTPSLTNGPVLFCLPQTREWQDLLLSLHTLPVPEPGVPVHLGVVSHI